jgi:hypothetical protein
MDSSAFVCSLAPLHRLENKVKFDYAGTVGIVILELCSTCSKLTESTEIHRNAITPEKQLMKETPHVSTCREIHLLARFRAAEQSNALISTL